MESTSLFNDSKGYTLVETTVALSLFLVILLPLSVSMIRFMQSNLNMERAEALHLAHYHMNMFISIKINDIITISDMNDYIKEEECDRYTVRITSNVSGRIVLINVFVFQINNPASPPLVTLKTARIHDY